VNPQSGGGLCSVQVLSDKDQETLRYQQEKFARSQVGMRATSGPGIWEGIRSRRQTHFAQTWYRPHATATHRAFPMSWALWNTIVSASSLTVALRSPLTTDVVQLMVGNSFFQCILW
jgi:hypothetical protein